MGHGSTDCGHPITHWGKHSGLPHNAWGAGLCPQELDYKHGTNTRTGSGCVLQGLEFRQKDTIRAWLPYGKDMVPRVNIPHTRRVRETAECHDFMARVERVNFPPTLVHPAKEKRWRRMWPYTHNCQELCTLSIPAVSARTTIRNTNCWMVAFMGPDGTEQETALTETGYPRRLSIYVGMRWTWRMWHNKGVQNRNQLIREDCTTLCTTCVGRQQNPRRCGSPVYGHKQPGLQYGKTWGKHLFLGPLKRHGIR